jgi:hypothetical protein
MLTYNLENEKRVKKIFAGVLHYCFGAVNYPPLLEKDLLQIN